MNLSKKAYDMISHAEKVARLLGQPKRYGIETCLSIIDAKSLAAALNHIYEEDKKNGLTDLDIKSFCDLNKNRIRAMKIKHDFVQDWEKEIIQYSEQNSRNVSSNFFWGLVCSFVFAAIISAMISI